MIKLTQFPILSGEVPTAFYRYYTPSNVVLEKENYSCCTFPYITRGQLDTMHSHLILLLAAASTAVAEPVLAEPALAAIPKQAASGVSSRMLLPGFGSALYFEEKRAGSCGIGQIACHTGCIPISGRCCATSGWCTAGTVCDDIHEGCCQIGKVCNKGPTGGCGTGYTSCMNKCMPSGADCCSDGMYCKSGTRCDGNGGCIAGSGSDSGSSSGSGSGSESGGQCLSSEDPCDKGCMPKGAVCCHNGKYCDAGEICLLPQLTCRSRGTGGGDGGGRASASVASQATKYSLTVVDQSSSQQATIQQTGDPITPLPTSGPNGGGGNGGNSPSPTATTKAAAAPGAIQVPSLLVAIALALPFWIFSSS